MLTCPMCKKGLDGVVRECPRCRADLSLLFDHVGHLEDGLARAEVLTRQGELGEAVWAYLEVLEVDPENPIARRQVGRVATAVRQFDRTAPGRRWLTRLRRQAAVRRWLQDGVPNVNWRAALAVVLVILTAFVCGFLAGSQPPSSPAALSGEPPGPPPATPD
jgi:hypothetical protein